MSAASKLKQANIDNQRLRIINALYVRQMDDLKSEMNIMVYEAKRMEERIAWSKDKVIGRYENSSVIK